MNNTESYIDKYEEIETPLYNLEHMLHILYDYTEQNMDYEKVFPIQTILGYMTQELQKIIEKI